MIQPVRVLFLAADPSTSESRLRFDEELREVQDAIHYGRECHALDVQPRLAARSTDIQTLLLRETPQILHFSGHGDQGCGIVMDEGDALHTTELVRLVAHFRNTVRVVVLNACTTLPLAQALSPLVDYVIGTEAAVMDTTAIAFSRALYGALAFGQTVPDAFALAENALAIEHFPDSHVYRLLARSAVVRPLRDLYAQADAPPAGETSTVPGGRQRIRIGNAATKKATFNSRADKGAQGGEQDVAIRDLKSDETIEFNA